MTKNTESGLKSISNGKAETLSDLSERYDNEGTETIVISFIRLWVVGVEVLLV